MRPVYLCCIVKNEALYIEEWIEYHLLKGVSYFFFYDHGSTDNTVEILNKYRDLELCSINDWSHVPVPAQRKAYSDCLNFCKGFHPDVWLGFLDADEFCVSEYQLDIAFEKVERDNTGVLLGNWILFGSSGHKERPEGLVIENYTHSEPPFNQHVKCFCIPERTLQPGNDAHTFLPAPGFTVHLSNGAPGKIGWPFQEMDMSMNPVFWVHHYHTKSKEEYRKRCERGRVDMIEKKQFDINFPHHDRNDILNVTLSDYVEPVKRKLKERNER